MKTNLTFGFLSLLCVLAALLPCNSSAQTGVVVGNLYVPTSPGGAVPSPPSGAAEAAVPGNTRVGTTGVTDIGATRILTTGTVTLEAVGEATSPMQDRGPAMTDTDAQLITAYGTSQVRATSSLPGSGTGAVSALPGGSAPVGTAGPGSPAGMRP